MTSNIGAYIKKHASNRIQSRAKHISLNKKSQEGDKHIFSCKGSEKEPYTITINISQNAIKTNCTCPFDYQGLCKHEVAALNYIANEKLPLTTNKDLFGNKVATPKYGEIYLENHRITDALIETLSSKRSSYNSYYEHNFYSNIIALDGNYIKTTFNDWPPKTQQFTYHSNTNILKVKCSCKESKKKYCSHIIAGLHKIRENYGENIFDPNYLNDQIEEFLGAYGMTKNDNYEKFFEFSMTLNGFEVVEKVKNIVPSVEFEVNNLIPKLDEKTKTDLQVLLKPEAKEEATHGIGFCFDVYKKKDYNLFQFYPFKAKYKKHTNTFISSFKEIDSYNFLQYLKDINTDKQIVFDALAFKMINNTFLSNFSVSDLREAFIKFNSLLEQTKDYLFFIKKHKVSFINKHLNPVVFSEEFANLHFTFKETEDFYVLKPLIEVAGKNYQINSYQITIYPLFCVKDNIIYRFKSPNEFLYISRLQQRSELRFQKREYAKLYKDVIQPLSEHFEVTTKVYPISKKRIDENDIKKQVFISDYEGEYVIFKLGIQYDKNLILIHTKEVLFDEKTQKITKRNTALEDEFLEEFKELHPDFQEQNGIFYLFPYQLIEEEWLLKASQKMSEKGIEVFGAKELKSFKFNLNKPSISMGIKSDLDWFDLEIEVAYGKQKVSLKDIRKALLKKSKYVTLGDGTLGLLPKAWLNKFSTYFKAGDVKNSAIKISNYQFNIIDELYEDIKDQTGTLIALQRKKQKLQNLKNIQDVASPKGLKAELRPYQLEGLKWLVFLEENNLGGCLADDMGLGKTLQTIAFLNYLKVEQKVQHPHLIIAPTSLMFNWQNEIEKFCPSLKTLIYTGLKRKQQLKNFNKYDLILTTYGSVVNDIEKLKDITFDYLILDESQAIKNPNSKRYKAVRLLQPKNRLALTGTPIENNTFDLYAQMNFLNPGLLGSRGHFKTEFSDAIDKAKNEEASKLLSKMIHPFLLRRTKAQVATELPEKTESVLYCEMGTEQRKVYDTYKNKFRDYLLNKIDENGIEKSQMYVLEGLTKLRQICNSPELLSDDEDYGKTSIKLDILTENIKVKTKEHKILIFSQFTSMLQLIKERLDNEDIEYEYLDGKTKQRQDNVNNFQENENIRVFLISLKAGGTGLNLTAADYVFLVDPWWNPAVENQAMDRSHRIGQTKHVMVYKMICKDTIEEKIIDLQKNKKQVSNSIIQVDNVKKSFNIQEIKAIFS